MKRKEKEFKIIYIYRDREVTRDEAIEILKEDRQREQMKNERTDTILLPREIVQGN